MDEKKIELHPIKNEDLEFLYQVYAGTRQAEMAITGWPEQQVSEFLRMQFELQHKQYMNYEGGKFYVIVYNSQDVGRLYVQRRDKEIVIVDIALLPDKQKMGIGTKLLQDLINEAVLKNVPLRLHVEYNNPALFLYERLGFKKGELFGIYYPMERMPYESLES